MGVKLSSIGHAPLQFMRKPLLRCTLRNGVELEFEVFPSFYIVCLRP